MSYRVRILAAGWACANAAVETLASVTVTVLVPICLIWDMSKLTPARADKVVHISPITFHTACNSFAELFDEVQVKTNASAGVHLGVGAL